MTGIAAVPKFCASWPALADVTASCKDQSSHSYRRDGLVRANCMPSGGTTIVLRC